MATKKSKGPRSLADLRKGATLEGDSGIMQLIPPDWYDANRLIRVNKWFVKHCSPIVLIWHCSLTIGLSLPSLLQTLVYTKLTDTPAKSVKRYLRTLHHLMLWHTGDIFKVGSPAHESLCEVRAAHKRVRESLNANASGECPDGTKTCWISQFNMACVQSGFMGLLVLHSKKFGIRASEEELEDYIYFWRCIGYQLGIADDFNICSLGKANAEHIVQQIADEMVLVHIQNPPPMFAPMAHAYIDGLNLIARSKVFSLASTLALVTPLFTGVVPPLDAGDWWRMQWRKVYFNAIKYIPGLEEMLSAFLVQRFLKMQLKHTDILQVCSQSVGLAATTAGSQIKLEDVVLLQMYCAMFKLGLTILLAFTALRIFAIWDLIFYN